MTPKSCVLSAPTWFTPAQTQALREAAEAAGIHVVQVLDEAAAVLVGYRVGMSEERKERGLLGQPEEGNAGENEQRDKRVVVLDMGETSLAISVIAVAEGEYTVLEKGRDDKLGGREFDNLVRSSLFSLLPIPSAGGRTALTYCSFSSISPKSSRRRPRSHSTCHAMKALRKATSAPRRSFVSLSSIQSDLSRPALVRLPVPS